MNSELASPGSRERSDRRARLPRALSPTASLLQPHLNAVEKASEPEFELLRSGSRCQLVGQLNHMRVLRGWQRAVEVAQRHVLGRAKAAGPEVVHRLLQDRGQDLMSERSIDVRRQNCVEAALPQRAECQLPAAQRIRADRY